MLRTDRLLLVPALAEHLESLIANKAAFPRLYRQVAAGYLEFPGALEYSLDGLRNGAVTPEWGTYLFILAAEETLIGLGGYKGAPDKGGAVEFGYGIAPAYRNQGYATEAAGALIQHAFDDPRVRVVCAETLARASESTSVLKKCGLLPVAERIDPVDGPIWRWEIRRP